MMLGLGLSMAAPVGPVPEAEPGAPSAPGAVGDLRGTGHDGSVSLAWEAKAGATGYKVYRDGVFLAGLGDVQAYVDAPVTNGQVYKYRVTATNAGGESGLSNEVSVTPASEGEVYVRTAFLSSTGNDGTAVLNDVTKPYATVNAAIIALNVAYAAMDVTVRTLDDAVSLSCSPSKARTTAGLTFKAHVGLMTISGLVDTHGADGDPGSEGAPGGNGGNGEDGGSITLDGIELAEFLGSGGAGGAGGHAAEASDSDGGNGGNGGDGGNVTRLNGATVTSFTSNGGAGGAGGGGDGTGADGAPGDDGAAGQEL